MSQLSKAIDLSALASSFGPKIKKDEQRIRLFLAACQNKNLELVGKLSPAELVDFDRAALVLLADGLITVQTGGLLSIFKDPLKGWREDVRDFARHYELDPVFIKAMG